jgi:hypothetical protein
MQRLGLLVLIAAVSACGGRPAPRQGDLDDAGIPPADGPRRDGAAVPGDGPRRDGPASDGSRPDAGPSAFCQGNPRVAVDGQQAWAFVSGEMIYMDCCDAAEIVFEPQDVFDATIAVMWRRYAGGAMPTEVTLDLANLANEWGVTVFVDCDPASGAGCASPANAWRGTLSGTLAISGDYDQYTMTLCAEGVPDASAPAGYLGAFKLWAQDVVASGNWP